MQINADCQKLRRFALHLLASGYLHYTRIKNHKLMAKKKKIPVKDQIWIDARKQFRLSDVHVQMARELGMNPKKFGKLANHKQEPWKLPLPDFIEELYFKRFKKERPEVVKSVERSVKERNKNREERKGRKAENKSLKQKSDKIDKIPF